MPIGEFEFLDNFQSFYYQWKYWTGNEENGFILEVDLECPESLHEKFRAFPLCPEHLLITYAMLSPTSKKLLKCNGVEKTTYKQEKLTATFLKKKKYVIHYTCLK